VKMETTVVKNSIDVLIQAKTKLKVTTSIQDFIKRNEDVFIYSNEEARLVGNFVQNARNEKARMLKYGAQVPVTIHLIAGKGVLVNWDLVDEEKAIQLKSLGMRPSKMGSVHKTSVTKEITETKEY
jgi:hypothetical protein